MVDYAKYTVSPAIIAASAYGLWLGGGHVLLGLAILLGLLLFDALLPPDYSMRDQRFPWLYDGIVTVQILAGFALIIAYAHWVGAGHFATWPVAIGAFATMMATMFVLVAPALHEMFHRENAFLRTVGRAGMVMIFDPWREITHVVTHHVHTVTPHDPDYARRGDNLYGHLWRTFSAQIRESYHLEQRMWTKRGRAWWHPRNAWVWRASLLVAFALLLGAAGGAWGAVAAIAVCLAGPRAFLEIFNYTQHYGLVTGTPGRFERRHTWNHLTPFVRLLALEITNHAGHHEDSYKPFYQLEPDRTGPAQPQFLLCILMAFIPPLWFAMIRPRLAHWDRHYANAQERELAEVENIRAGWADLNENPTAAARRHAYTIR
ncbi:MAG: fatty acid desaturase [Sphingopyxis sp.]